MIRCLHSERRTHSAVPVAVLVLAAILTSSGRADDGRTVGASFDAKISIAFPPSAAVVDVTKAPYNAKGDGKTDDTAALQKAFSDNMGRRKIIYFPNGTYLVSGTLRWSKKNSKNEDAWGFNWVQGQSTGKTILRLKDGTFADPKAGKPILWCGGFGSADWFHNYIQNITFDTGSDNAGAIGLQFYSNNTGAVRDVEVVSRDGKGMIGLDVGFADMNGPLLVKNVLVRGFETGIRAAASVNSQTFEHITLVGQSKVGMVNFGQSISIRGLSSDNAVPALKTEGFAVLIDAKLVGRTGASQVSAVEVGKAPFFARNVGTSGYRSAIRSEAGKGADGPEVAEFMQGPSASPFAAPLKSLGLAVKETPEVPWDSPGTWAVVDAFGADPTGNKESSAAIQKAIDSGATTVFFPGSYNLTSPVRVRGKVRRLLGSGGWIDYNKKQKIDFIVEDGASPVVAFEHFAPINGGIEIDTARTVVIRSMEPRHVVCKNKGEVFFEDVSTDELKFNPGQKVWARQLNVENQGTHVTNDGGRLWVLGYKTERGGTLLHTLNGGESEILGNMSYTTTAGKLGPMFRTEESKVFAFFNEVCYSGDPFATLIDETTGGVRKTVERGRGFVSPYVSFGPKK